MSPREESQWLQNCVVHGDLRNRSISCYGSARNYMRGIFFSLKSVCLVPTAPSGWQLIVHGIFFIHELIPETASEQYLTLGTASRHITVFFHPLQFSQRSHHSRTQHCNRHRSGWNKPSWGLDPLLLGVKLANCRWWGHGIFLPLTVIMLISLDQFPPPSFCFFENLHHPHWLVCSETLSLWKHEARNSLFNWLEFNYISNFLWWEKWVLLWWHFRELGCVKPEQTRRAGLNMFGINSWHHEGDFEWGGPEGALLELPEQASTAEKTWALWGGGWSWNHYMMTNRSSPQRKGKTRGSSKKKTSGGLGYGRSSHWVSGSGKGQWDRQGISVPQPTLGLVVKPGKSQCSWVIKVNSLLVLPSEGLLRCSSSQRGPSCGSSFSFSLPHPLCHPVSNKTAFWQVRLFCCEECGWAAHCLSHSRSQQQFGAVYMGMSMEPYVREPAQPQPRGRSHFDAEDTSEATTPISTSLSEWRQPGRGSGECAGWKQPRYFESVLPFSKGPSLLITSEFGERSHGGPRMLWPVECIYKLSPCEWWYLFPQTN